ncbi:MAG TPA: aldo/keto reductase [Solirubrobacterales bacterium]|nr:aldo/keto reductase [Solirubrobacterales bacterium]
MSTTAPTTPLPTGHLGDSELEVSMVGLGCNNFGRRLDLEGTAAVLESALEAGITFFDTADIYGGGGESERLMGEALEGRREEFLIATKFGMEMKGVEGVPAAARGSREYIRWAVEGTRLAGGASGTDAQFDVVEALRTYAEERGVEMIDVAISGLAAQRAVGSVIAGATKPEQGAGQRRRGALAAERG